MTFGAAVTHGLQNLTNFKGRARRSEFWWFYLFIFLISIPLAVLSMIPAILAFIDISGSVDPATNELTDAQTRQLLGAVGLTYALSLLAGAVTFFLILALWVRRLHDAGYSGHWLWLSLAGLSIVPLIFAFFDSKWGPNQWGEDPKAAERGLWTPQQSGQAYAAPPPTYPPVATQPPPASVNPNDPVAGPPQ